jgi:hypothetical protein
MPRREGTSTHLLGPNTKFSRVPAAAARQNTTRQTHQTNDQFSRPWGLPLDCSPGIWRSIRYYLSSRCLPLLYQLSLSSGLRWVTWLWIRMIAVELFWAFYISGVVFRTPMKSGARFLQIPGIAILFYVPSPPGSGGVVWATAWMSGPRAN